MALTRAQIQTAFQNSLGRAASTSEENSYFSVSQSGALPDATIYTTISNSQEANLNADPVVRFYQSAFGRVPDQAGLDNATDYVRSFGASAQTYQNLANQFVTSPEFQARFGAGTTVDAAYVQALYTTILGRQASAGEIAGYTSGSNGYTTRGGVLYAISQSQEAIGISDNAVNGFLNNAAQGTAVYSGTLYSPANGQPNIPGAPLTNLTTGVDNIVGTNGNDVINGVIDGTTAANSTFTVADTINGGAGTDSLNVIISSGAAIDVPVANVTNVENFFIRNLGTGEATFNAAAVAGEQQVWNDRSSGDLKVTGLGTGATIGVRGDGLNNVGATTFNYATATDAVTVAIDGGVKGGAAITNNQTGATTATVNSTGAANTVGVITLDNSGGTLTSATINATTGLTGTLVGADFAANASLKITGAGAVDLTGVAGNLGANVTTIDASGNAGGVKLQSTTAANLTFTGGTGNDYLRLDGTLTAADKLVGGTGRDTISITGEDFTTASNVKLAALNTTVTGFEVLELTGNGATTIQGGTTATSLTNSEITKILFNTDGADIVNSAGSARLYAVGADNTGNLTLNLGTGVTTVNVSLEGNAGTAAGTADIGTLAVNLDAAAPAGSLTTLNIASTLATGTSQGANTITTLTDVLGSTYKITGSQDLTVGTLTNAGTIDATSFTGKFGLTTGAAGNTVINLGSGGTATTGVNTGAGVDTVTAQGGTNIINTGAGNDTVTLTAGTNTVNGGAGADSITLGSGADKLVYTTAGNSTAATPATTLDTVTSFTAGTDKFIVGTVPTTLSQGAAFTAAGTGTLSTDIGSALTAGGLTGANAIAVGNAAVVTITGTGAGTYLVYNNATAGYDTTDTVVKLAGLSGTLATTDFATA